MAPTAARPANEHVIACVNMCQDNSCSRCDVSVAGIGGDIAFTLTVHNELCFQRISILSKHCPGEEVQSAGWCREDAVLDVVTVS